MVGLARRQSPHRGSRDRYLAAVLADELPATREAMVRGEGGRQHAETIARHTVFLSREDRGRVDAELGPQIGELSPRALGKRACHRAYELDPEAHTRHAALEHSQRRVTMAPPWEEASMADMASLSVERASTTEDSSIVGSGMTSKRLSWRLVIHSRG